MERNAVEEEKFVECLVIKFAAIVSVEGEDGTLKLCSNVCVKW